MSDMSTTQVIASAPRVAANSAIIRIVNLSLDIAMPLIKWLLLPWQTLVNWFYNKFLADRNPAPAPVLLPIYPHLYTENPRLYIPMSI